MQTKIISFAMLPFFLASIAVITFALSFKSNTKIISPLPQNSYAEESKPSATPTPTNSPTPTLTPTPTPIPPTPTRIPTPVIVVSANLDDLFTKYSNEYSVDKELLKRIAKCESGLNPNASTSLYAGLYQFSESLWVSTRTLMGHNSDPNLRFDAQEAIRTAAFMISQNHLGIWPNCNK